MAALDEAFHLVSSTFKIPELNSHQKQAIRKIVSEKKDLFVNLPTGFGKSLIYQALPLVFDHVTKQPGHIVVVLSADKPYGGSSKPPEKPWTFCCKYQFPGRE